MASIKPYEKKGRTFYSVTVYVGRDELSGKPRYIKKSSFPNKADAKLWASRKTLEAQGGGLVNSQNMTFKQVYERWFTTYKNTVRPASWRVIGRTIELHVLPTIGHIRLQKLTTPVLQKAVNEWATSGVKSFVDWYRRAVTVLRYALKQRYILHDPSQGVVIPKLTLPADETENFWDKAELAHFFSLLDPIKQTKQFTEFRMLAFSGMRRGELLALTWHDLDFTNNSVSITKTISIGADGSYIIQPPKTAAGIRVVSLDPETIRIIKRWHVTQITEMLTRGINANKPDQLLFPTNKNTLADPGTLGNWLTYFQKKHKITHTITVHGFRHTHATALIAAGVPLKVIQKRLGHENIQTTLNIYAHATANQSTEAAAQVAGYLNF